MNGNINIFNNDCLEEMKNIKDKSIDLIFTSPPYYINLDYETHFNSYNQYLKWVNKWIKETKRILKLDGIFLLNIANNKDTPIKSHEILEICIENNYKLHDTIIWAVNNRQPSNSNKYLTNQQEYIFMLVNRSLNIKLNKNIIDKYSNIFLSKNISNIWVIPFISNKNNKIKYHSGFPKLLCDLVIDLFTNENDLVLDFFLGSGMLGLSCIHKNRRFIGIEKDKDIFDFAKKRLNE